MNQRKNGKSIADEAIFYCEILIIIHNNNKLQDFFIPDCGCQLKNL